MHSSWCVQTVPELGQIIDLRLLWSASACQWRRCALMLGLVKQQTNTSVIVLKGSDKNED